MKRISSYKELIAEQRRTEELIASYKRAFREDIQQLKDKVDPFFNILPILNIFKKDGSQTTGNHSIAKAGASMAIDLLVGHKLRKASWFLRLIVPNLLKVVSSAVIGGKKRVLKDPLKIPVTA